MATLAPGARVPWTWTRGGTLLPNGAAPETAVTGTLSNGAAQWGPLAKVGVAVAECKPFGDRPEPFVHGRGDECKPCGDKPETLGC